MQLFFFLMIRRPPRSTLDRSSAASDVYKRQTSGYHDGEKPDARAIKVAKDKGLSIEKQISRKITKEDLYYYNLICVMDAQNYNEVKRFSQLHQTEANIELLLNLVYPGQNRQVPDPYYDGKFEEVYNICLL